jgi:hypothetical protein
VIPTKATVWLGWSLRAITPDIEQANKQVKPRIFLITVFVITDRVALNYFLKVIHLSPYIPLPFFEDVGLSYWPRLLRTALQS